MGKCITKAIQTYLGTFRHNQTYPRIIQAYPLLIRTLYNLVYFMKLLVLMFVLIVSCIFRTLVYLASGHIQSQKHIQNPGLFKTLVYSQPRYSGTFRTLAYSKPDAYPEHCQTSAMKRFVKVVNGYNYFLSTSLPRSLLLEINTIRKLLQTQLFYIKIVMARNEGEESEFLINLLIYSNNFPYLQLIAILVCRSSPPKSLEQGYLNFQQKPSPTYRRQM